MTASIEKTMSYLNSVVGFHLLAVSCLTAQTVVSPAHFERAAAPGSSSLPIGTSALPVRYLQVHDDLGGTPRTIHGIDLRRDSAGTSSYGAFTVTLDAFLSNAVTTASSVNATFDLNHGLNRVQVATARVISFPATVHGKVPAPFVYQMPFDTPFLFNGTGSLCWEVRITSRTAPGPIALDLAQGSDQNPPLALNPLGSGCRATGAAAPLTLGATSSMSWSGGSGVLNYAVTFGVPSSIAVILAGTSDTSFAGLVLPWEIPTTNGAPSGTCRIYNSVALMLAATTDASGNASVNLPVPASPLLHGGNIFGQALMLDAMANPFGAVTSNTVQANFVAPYNLVPVGSVELTQGLSSLGTPRNNNGLVVSIQ